MVKVDYDSLRQHDATPLMEFEDQLRQRIKREAEGGDQDDKKKRKRGRRGRK